MRRLGVASHSRWLAGIASVLLLALLPLTAPATARDSRGLDAIDASGVVSKALHQNPAAVRDYWTPQRMREAQPRALLAPVTGAVGALPETGGEPRRLAAVATGNEDGFPNRLHGRVFATDNLGDFSCSGTVVHSRGRSLVVTAGHCVHFDDSAGWATNFEFIPGYRDGQRPYGRWVARELAAPQPWLFNGNSSYDVGMATLRRNNNGVAIQDRVGARGIAFNQSRNQTYHAYGYPAETNAGVLPPRFFDGQRLYRCVSGKIGEHDPPGSGPNMTEIRCDMTAGSSGGGWVIDGEFVNSLNSLGPPGGGNWIDGPYFGGVIKNLYEESRGKTIRCEGAPVTHLGTRGADSIAGDGNADSIKLRAGDDTATGDRGPDRLCGGPGRDRLVGGPGFDICNGNRGRDTATGCEVEKSAR